MKSAIRHSKPKIVIAGAGPAGTSAAIRLAQKGFTVSLIEREKFPRQKLCGEFISPECFRHFKDLGVSEKIFSFGGERIAETIFYGPGGKSVNVPSKWFNAQERALGLSRAEMDFCLLQKARAVGSVLRHQRNRHTQLGQRFASERKESRRGIQLAADRFGNGQPGAHTLGALIEIIE